jgi:hypothetical protein
MTTTEQIQTTKHGIPIDESFAKAASEESLQKTTAALRTRNFSVEVVDTPAAARAYVNSILPKDLSIFTSSSETVNLSGLDEDINRSGRYNAIRPQMEKLDYKTQRAEMLKLGASPDVVVGSGDAMSGVCDLLHEPLSFDAISDAGGALHGPCDECLQSSCCDAVVSCFVNNPDCTAITPCVNQCAVDCPPGGGGGGGGDGGGGGGGKKDSGACPYTGTTEVLDSGLTVAVDPYDQCLNACTAAHQASMATYQMFSACYLETCASVCPHG